MTSKRKWSVFVLGKGLNVILCPVPMFFLLVNCLHFMSEKLSLSETYHLSFRTCSLPNIALIFFPSTAGHNYCRFFQSLVHESRKCVKSLTLCLRVTALSGSSLVEPPSRSVNIEFKTCCSRLFSVLSWKPLISEVAQLLYLFRSFWSAAQPWSLLIDITWFHVLWKLDWWAFHPFLCVTDRHVKHNMTQDRLLW